MGVVSVYGIQITAANYSQSVLPIILTVPVLYVVEKFIRKHMPDTLSTIFTPFCTLIVVVPIMLIVLAPLGNEVGNVIAGALFGLADMGGIAVFIVMAILGAFWQLFVVAGMHLPVILLAQVQIIAAGYDPFVFVSTNCAMTAVWGCAFGAFLRMKNKDEKGLALGYVISAIAGGVTEPALFGILLRFRRTMLGMFIGGAIGAVLSGILGVTYYLAGGSLQLHGHPQLPAGRPVERHRRHHRYGCVLRDRCRRGLPHGLLQGRARRDGGRGRERPHGCVRQGL